MRTKYYYTLEEMRGNNTTWAGILGSSTDATTASTSATLLSSYIIPRFDEAVVKISSSGTSPDYTYLKSKMLAWLTSTYNYYNTLIGLYTAQESHLLDQINSVSTDTRANVITGGNTNTATMGIQHSESRTNDTPQNGGDWDDDEHTSSIDINDTNEYENTYKLVYDSETRTNSGSITVNSDPDTIINRLEDIRKKYINLYEEWAKKFYIFVYNPATFEEQNSWGLVYYEDEV